MQGARLLILVGLLGCRDSTKPAPAVTPPPPSASPDPWALRAGSADDPPTLGERHRRADEACPLVRAPYFYRVEKADKVSHLLGTRHLSVGLGKFPAHVRDAISSAKLAVFEVDPGDDADTPSEEISIEDALGPEQWKHYTELVGAMTAETVKTASAAEAMLRLIAMYEDITATLDLEIEREVAAKNIPTMGLETSAFQDALIDKLLDARMLKAEVSQTKDRNELAKDARDDLSEYCAGTDEEPGMDPATRAKMIDAGYSQDEIDAIDEQMVYARNRDWIPKLEGIFAQGDVFVAVGADHLIGERGVVSLLTERGYTVTRVTR